METQRQAVNLVEQFVEMVGGMQRAAVLLGVTRQTMHTLCKQGRVNNAIIAIRIEDLTRALEDEGKGTLITVRELAGETETWTGPTLRSTSPFTMGPGRWKRMPSSGSSTHSPAAASVSASIRRAA